MGLIGALVLVVAVEAWVGRWADRLSDYQTLGTRFAASRARWDAPECAVLGLGDSTMKFGFDPMVVEQELGGRAYNLAVPGSPPPLTHALLRRAFLAGARPKAVVIGHLTFSGDPLANLSEFSELFGPWEAAQLAWAARDPNVFTGIFLRWTLPSLHYRQTIRGLVRDGAGDDRSSKFLHDWALGRGMERRLPDGRYDGRMEPALERSVYSSPWLVHSLFEEYTRHTVRLAARYGATVFWVMPPIAPGAQARRESLGLDDLHTRNLQVIASWSPGLIVLDGRRLGVPDSGFFDSCHLNTVGAEVLTASIAHAIARPSETPAWVTLAPVSPPARIAEKVVDPPR
jgi:hypothetical protein